MTKDQVKRVAVIGAGGSGLAVARALVAEEAFDEIAVLDWRAQPGGLWNYNPDKQQAETPVPSLNPHVDAEDPTLFISPMYEKLTTNLPPWLMAYNGIPFPKDTPQYPSRERLVSYFGTSAALLKDKVHFHFSTLVVDLHKDAAGTWKIATKNTNTNVTDTLEYDAVVLATGHYTIPYVPDIPGLVEWAENLGTVQHSKFYTVPDPYKGRTVLVIGNSASAIDISTQLLAVSKKIYRSIRNTESPLQLSVDIPPEYLQPVGVVASVDYRTRSAVLVDGTVISGIDDILYCTGYLFSFPFLTSYKTGDDALITDGQRVRRIYRQTFYIPDPSLAIVGMLVKVIPNPSAESQASIIARVFSSRLNLPSEEEMRESEQAELEVSGDSRDFHTHNFPKDVDFATSFYDWAKQAVPSERGFYAEEWTDERSEWRRTCLAEKVKDIVKQVQTALDERKQLEAEVGQ